MHRHFRWDYYLHLQSNTSTVSFLNKPSINIKEKGRKGNRNGKLRTVALCIELETYVVNCKKMKRADKTFLALYRT